MTKNKINNLINNIKVLIANIYVKFRKIKSDCDVIEALSTTVVKFRNENWTNKDRVEVDGKIGHSTKSAV